MLFDWFWLILIWYDAGRKGRTWTGCNVCFHFAGGHLSFIVAFMMCPRGNRLMLTYIKWPRVNRLMCPRGNRLTFMMCPRGNTPMCPSLWCMPSSGNRQLEVMWQVIVHAVEQFHSDPLWLKRPWGRRLWLGISWADLSMDPPKWIVVRPRPDLHPNKPPNVLIAFLFPPKCKYVRDSFFNVAVNFPTTNIFWNIHVWRLFIVWSTR